MLQIPEITGYTARRPGCREGVRDGWSFSDLWGLFSRTVWVLRACPWLGWLEGGVSSPSHSLCWGEGSFPRRTEDLRWGRRHSMEATWPRKRQLWGYMGLAA